jgi:hypothetical protein
MRPVATKRDSRPDFPLFHRRAHLAQLGAGAFALTPSIMSLLAASAGQLEIERAIRPLFAKLTTGRKFGPGRNNAWAIIEVGHPAPLYVQALVPPSGECVWLEAVSPKFVSNWKQIITARKLAMLAALGFREPGPRSPNFWQEIPRADTRSTDVAARIAALALREVYDAKKLASAQVKLLLPGEPPLVTTLGSPLTHRPAVGSGKEIQFRSKHGAIPGSDFDIEVPVKKDPMANAESAPAPKKPASASLTVPTPGIKDAPPEAYGKAFVIGGFPRCPKTPVVTKAE